MFIGRFIAKLSDGSIITECYPDEEVRHNRMGWGRLQEQLCEDLKIVSMSLEVGGRTHETLINAEGYFVNMRGMSTHDIQTDYHRGFGFVLDGKIFISWFNEKGDIVEVEVREV